ncbi:hypothetical protein B0T14DRAFT_528648 [Immersiella caudata]|uniref:Uncharacterized protein n=1 Tax=Immersiella caudata TaxID=314043 RepID=A0AA39WFQ8_9PEZI|nr:hypothetical protein B0T14DRAFT_528648 [Immersiella caudata]
MHALVVSALLARSLGAVAGPPSPGEVEHVRRGPHAAVITAAPEAAARLEQRQILGADWMGFAYYSGQWVTMTCPSGQIFAGDGSTWDACCTKDVPCLYATACGPGGEILGIQGSGATEGCGPSARCDTVTILNSKGVAATGVRSLIQCIATADFYEQPRTWYRDTAGVVSSTSSSSTVSTTTETVTQQVTSRPSRDAAGRLSTRGGWSGGLWGLLAVLLGIWVGLFV